MNKSHETLAKRVEQTLPELVKILPPIEKNMGIYARIRHAYLYGICSGEQITLDEIKGVLEVASGSNVRNKLCWLCKALSKANIKRTLSYVRELMGKTSAGVMHAVKAGAITSKDQFRSATWFAQRLSIDQMVCATERAMKKRNPGRYLLKTLYLMCHGNATREIIS